MVKSTNSSKSISEMRKVTKPPLILRLAQWPESRKQLGKHRLGTAPTIEAIFKFLGIKAKIFWADAGMRSGD